MGIVWEVLQKPVLKPPEPSWLLLICTGASSRVVLPSAGLWASCPRDGKICPGNLSCEAQKGERAVPLLLPQIEVKLSVKFTSREFSLKRMPSRKQTGVFGVKIAVVTK